MRGFFLRVNIKGVIDIPLPLTSESFLFFLRTRFLVILVPYFPFKLTVFSDVRGGSFSLNFRR